MQENNEKQVTVAAERTSQYLLLSVTKFTCGRNSNISVFRGPDEEDSDRRRNLGAGLSGSVTKKQWLTRIFEGK